MGAHTSHAHSLKRRDAVKQASAWAGMSANGLATYGPWAVMPARQGRHRPASSTWPTHVSQHDCMMQLSRRLAWPSQHRGLAARALPVAQRTFVAAAEHHDDQPKRNVCPSLMSLVQQRQHATHVTQGFVLAQQSLSSPLRELAAQPLCYPSPTSSPRACSSLLFLLASKTTSYAVAQPPKTAWRQVSTLCEPYFL